MVTGNEFQEPGEKNINKQVSEHGAENLQRESQERVASTGYDAAKAQCMHLNGEHHSWMSMGQDPEGFKAKTAELLNQSPEGMMQSLKENDAKVHSLRAYMAGIESKIANVQKAQQVQEEFERANRH